MDDHDTKDNNKNDKDEPCQPITWYNIFHYSIFGEQNSVMKIIEIK